MSINSNDWIVDTCNLPDLIGIVWFCLYISRLCFLYAPTFFRLGLAIRTDTFRYLRAHNAHFENSKVSKQEFICRRITPLEMDRNQIWSIPRPHGAGTNTWQLHWPWAKQKAPFKANTRERSALDRMSASRGTESAVGVHPLIMLLAILVCFVLLYALQTRCILFWNVDHSIYIVFYRFLTNYIRIKEKLVILIRFGLTPTRIAWISTAYYNKSIRFLFFQLLLF